MDERGKVKKRRLERKNKKNRENKKEETLLESEHNTYRMWNAGYEYHFASCPSVS
jgi:hypothetical protein